MTTIYLGPLTHRDVEQAIRDAGGDLVGPGPADAIVWTDPRAMRDLFGMLSDQVRWVSLPFAGVDGLLRAGLIDDSRTWTATTGVYGDAVAEHALALLLACTRRLGRAGADSTWKRQPGWRLRGATVAVIGTGGIGRRCAELLRAFGATSIGVSRTGAAVDGFDEVVSIDDVDRVLAASRATILAVPLTDSTHGLIGRERLEFIGAEGVLVNVARGEVVDTEELVAALSDGRLGAAGLDVTDPEPLPDGHPLWALDTAVISAHVANPFTQVPWDACVAEYAAHVGGNVRAFGLGTTLSGTIDPQRGY